jgi:uncharacterized protein YjbJ (UPF0337 family)
MNRKTHRKYWNDLKGRVEQRWDRLTGRELDWIEGNYDRFISKLQEKYGMTRQQAERELDEFRTDIQLGIG